MNKEFINIVDTTLRDGSHAVSHGFTPEQVTAIVRGLDEQASMIGRAMGTV